MDDLIEEIFYIITSNPVGQHLAALETVPLDERENVTIENLLAEIHGGGEVQITSIQNKLQGKYYTENIYMLYRDLKLATSSELIKLPIGCEPYVALDEFFRFIVGLVSREGMRLGLIPSDIIPRAEGANDESEALMDTTMDSKIADGFVRMIAEIKEWYGESYYFIGPHGPVFSSHNGRSPIDPRDAETHGAISTTKLVPELRGVDANPLSYVSQMGFMRSVHPSLAPTELLTNYVEPKSVALSSSKWLKYDAYSSFAPSVDDASAVVGSQASGAVWFEKIGVTKLEMMDDEEIDEEERSRSTREPSEAVVDDAASSEIKEAPALDEMKSDRSITTTTTTSGESGQLDMSISVNDDEELDIASILEWRPSHFIDDDELEAAKTQTESQLLTRLILRLQILQRERFASRTPKPEFTPNEEEKRLGYKIQNLLARLTQQVSPQELGLSPSPYIPVSLTNYAGVLPARDSKPVQRRPDNRAPAQMMRKVSRMPVGRR